MLKQKRKALEAHGWKVGTVREFLRLSDEEAALIDLNLALGRALEERREPPRTRPKSTR